MAKTLKKPLKDQPRIIVMVPESLETEIEETCVRLAWSKTALIRRALWIYTKLEKEASAGAKVQIRHGNELSELLFP